MLGIPCTVDGEDEPMFVCEDCLLAEVDERYTLCQQCQDYQDEQHEKANGDHDNPANDCNSQGTPSPGVSGQRHSAAARGQTGR